MTFEDKLLNGIPLDEASDFFLRIRGQKTAALSPLEFEAAIAELPDSEREELLKNATGLRLLAPVPGALKKANAAVTAQPTSPLPPAAMGQTMPAPTPAQLPATALGQQKSAKDERSQDEIGKERGHAATAAHFERESHHKSEKNHEAVGRLAGGAAAAGASFKKGKRSPVSMLIAGTLGAHLGGKAGKFTGQKKDESRWVKKHGEAFKLALEATGMGPSMPKITPQPQQMVAPAAPVGIEPQLDPATAQYIQQEQEGGQQAELMHADFLRQKLQEAQAELAMAQQQAESATMQQGMHDEQLAQFQQQVTDATLRASAAQDQVLQQQQAAAAMRMAFQQLRGQVLQLAASDPPSLSPDASALIAAGQPPAGGQAPTAGAPAAQAGPAGQAPSPGTPNAPAGEGDETVSAPVKGPTSTGESKPSGETGTKEQDTPKKDKDEKSAGVSYFFPFVFDVPKTAALRDMLAGAAAKIAPRLPHAAVGGLIGAGLGAAEAGTSNAKLDQRVGELEANPDRGLGGTMNLAQLRARQTVGAFAEKHPAAMIGAGALGGALTGAAQGPETVDAIRRSGTSLGNIGGHLKTIIKGAA